MCLASRAKHSEINPEMLRGRRQSTQGSILRCLEIEGQVLGCQSFAACLFAPKAGPFESTVRVPLAGADDCGAHAWFRARHARLTRSARTPLTLRVRRARRHRSAAAIAGERSAALRAQRVLRAQVPACARGGARRGRTAAAPNEGHGEYEYGLESHARSIRSPAAAAASSFTFPRVAAGRRTWVIAQANHEDGSGIDGLRDRGADRLVR